MKRCPRLIHIHTPDLKICFFKDARIRKRGSTGKKKAGWIDGYILGIISHSNKPKGANRLFFRTLGTIGIKQQR